MGSKFCKLFWEWVWGKRDIWLNRYMNFLLQIWLRKIVTKKKHFLKSVITLWCSDQFRSRSHPQTSSPGHSRTANCFRETRENQLGRILQVPPLCKTKAGWKFHTRRIFLVFARYRPDRILPWREQKTISPDLHIEKKQRWWFQKTVLTLNPQISTVT